MLKMNEGIGDFQPEHEDTGQGLILVCSQQGLIMGAERQHVQNGSESPVILKLKKR